ncbi:ABC transporter ATP-binding protein [Cohaesibacter gelatinilyticus]|uniref:ABC-type dipeptide/oligopeptide/nickel transport system, ATPase component n=1 Tax=Cohaesibacter gelatinilyticus TaxID=372072 RepID=A0A285PDZ4_9HYPH|nr:ATP-binding cassette domain-containing protein [Cohaesibacter gelatinilyticus]SNZ19463.1 ABC-type dipeptide/oligopeptide/nickel transport system, ATPase component [Cohaesibacter gelatinilyticus]
MLEVRNLTKAYHGRHIFKDVRLSIKQGEVVGLIGRSGIGKSTLARCLVGLEQPDEGVFALDGETFETGTANARKNIQYLWQDASQSLSPYLTAHAALMETLNGFSIGAKEERFQKARGLLSDLGISPDMQARRPHALSGGQCQRVALARALAAEPKLLILDEPLSALDLITQNRTVELLKRLHVERNLTMLIVSHDLAPLQKMSNRILLLQQEGIVEREAVQQFLGRVE